MFHEINDLSCGMNFAHHCWAEIDLSALAENFAAIRQRVGGPVCAVVKADGYGHGARMVAKTLQEAGAAAFAVSSLAEGRELRSAGIQKPILILGYTDPAFAARLAEASIVQALFSAEYAASLSAAAVQAGVTVPCHLKLDTGMGRIGFCARSGLARAVADMEACYALPGLRIQGIFQHFAVADSTDPADVAYTMEQHDLFARAVALLQQDGFDPGTVHCANSAAQMTHPEWRGAMTRAGIILYGLDPSPEMRFSLRPAMTLKTVVSFVKELQPGQSVSYGRAFTANAPTRVATVCVGYADGYPRAMSGQGVMMVRGCAAPVVGRVCMDQTLLDVTAIPGVKQGDTVTVFGPGCAACGADTADAIAAKNHTINYEIVCGLSRRVPRLYLKDGAPVSIWNGLEET